MSKYLNTFLINVLLGILSTTNYLLWCSHTRIHLIAADKILVKLINQICFVLWRSLQFVNICLTYNSELSLLCVEGITSRIAHLEKFGQIFQKVRGL